MPNWRKSKAKGKRSSKGGSKWDYLLKDKVSGHLGRYYEGKTVAQLLGILQRHFNTFIRLRDRIDENVFKCKACGGIKPNIVNGKGNLNAGHLFAVASAKSLRFDEMNVHGICVHCNKYDEDHVLHLAEYVRKTYGQEVWDKLLFRSKADKVPSYFPFELVEKIEYYKAKNKELKNKQ